MVKQLPEFEYIYSSQLNVSNSEMVKYTKDQVKPNMHNHGATEFYIPKARDDDP